VKREKEAHLPSASSFNGGFAPDEDMIVKTRRIDGQTSNFSCRSLSTTTPSHVFPFHLPPRGVKKPGSSPDYHSLYPETTTGSSHLGPSPTNPSHHEEEAFRPLKFPKFRPTPDSVSVHVFRFVDNLAHSYNLPS